MRYRNGTRRHCGGDLDMGLPDFEFQPYEAGGLAPDEPLRAPAIARFEDRSFWRKPTYLARVARLHTGKNRVFIKSVHPTSPVLSLPKHNNVLPSTDLIHALNNMGWQRDIFFDSNWKLIQNVSERGSALTITGDDRTWCFDVCGLPCHFILDGLPYRGGWGTRYSAREIERRFNKARQKPDSDCAFMLRWIKLTPEQRWEWIYETGRGSFKECVQVLLWFALMNDWWQAGQEVVWVVDGLRDEKNPKKTKPTFLADGIIQHIPTQEPIILSPSQRKVLLEVDAYFGLSYNEECKRHHSLKISRASPWYLLIQPPSQHERLEARLNLREWLERNGLPALLGDA